MRYASAVCLAVLLLAASASADVRLPDIIGTNMVIQQGVPVPVWGWAEPGEKVSVAVGANKAEAVADAAGKWSCRLGVMKASDQPVEMTVSGKNTLTLKNILVGDVWLCAGQSNMAWPMSVAKNGEEEIKKADYPSIRLFVIRAPRQEEPRDDFLGYPGTKVPGGQWWVCNPKNIAQFSAVAYYFGRNLLTELKRPIGLIGEGIGGTSIEEWTSQETFKTDPELSAYPAKIADYEKKYVELKADYDKKSEAWRAAPEKDRPKYAPTRPLQPWEAYGGLYNALIEPLAKTPMTGILWYQGENNVNDGAGYAKMFPAMIRSWRRTFAQGDLPFLFVQLPNIGDRLADFNRTFGISELREAQMAALPLPRTAMIVTIDVGEAHSAHPVDKVPVGDRLARAALALAYGQNIVNPFCPLFESMKVEGPKLTVKFKFAEGGLVARGDKPVGFAIAGTDGKYFTADAVIAGDTVALTSDKVPAPVSVRYAWTLNPEVNLYNKADLPVSPFRAGEKPADKGIAWSDPGKDGLQLGIRLTKQTVGALREIEAEITVKNAGKAPLTINTWDLAGGYFGLVVLDPAGAPVPKVPPPMPAPQPGAPGYEKWQEQHKACDKVLKPGETFSFTCNTSINLTRPDGTYTIRFTHSGVTTPGVEVLLKAGK